jgi:dTDP-4-amino-4,6-dideoxygalactose transaminase
LTSKISVIGLGYVGLPLSVAASNSEFEVIGVDIDTKAARENISYDKRITIIDGDLTAPETIKAVYDAVGGRRAMIIEDAAQSFGASYNGIPSGRLGDVSVLSFDPTKNLPNYGSGGMILCDDLGWAEELYDMRDNGKHESHHFAGTNSRMSESDCAQMLIKLRHFDAWQDRRQEIAEYYTGELRDYVDVPVVADGVVHAWHKYVIRLSERHGLRSALAAEGIETRIHYDKTLTELPVSWKYDGYNPGQFRLSTAFTRECMSLPIYPEMTDGEIEQVVDAIQVYLR